MSTEIGTLLVRSPHICGGRLEMTNSLQFL
jgi:hypothetical protein